MEKDKKVTARYIRSGRKPGHLINFVNVICSACGQTATRYGETCEHCGAEITGITDLAAFRSRCKHKVTKPDSVTKEE